MAKKWNFFQVTPTIDVLKPLMLLLCLSIVQAKAQSSYYRVDDERINFYLDYIDVVSKTSKSFQLHTEFKPFHRSTFANIDVVSDASSKIKIPFTAKEFMHYSYSENKAELALREKPVLNAFYKTESDFFHYGGKEFDVFVNPVLGFEYGINSNGNYTRNSRGIEIKGQIGNKLGFYSYVTDNQVNYPTYLSDKINSEGVVPRQGFWKSFKDTGYDYFDALGYITFSPLKQIKMSFGNDRNFIGNGYRSLVLSDYAKDYLNLKIQTNIGKISYQNLFMELHNFSPLLGNTLLQKKYATMHRLGINLGDWGNIGFFESIIFTRGDSLGNNGGYDLAYMNPIIFYRSVEQNLGSKDNALLGMDFKANIKNTVSLYGQVVLDEFRLEHIRARNGWWANKYGIQAGLKYFEILGSNLHAQVEYNMVRPYTYAHTFTEQSYTHYGQPLAHPLGANFEEVIGILRWTPKWLLDNKLFVTAKAIVVNKGGDSTLNNDNHGGNIFLSNSTRVNEFDNILLQGVQQKTSIYSLELSYMALHNLFFDVSLHLRNFESAGDIENSENLLVRFALRYSIGRLKLDF